MQIPSASNRRIFCRARDADQSGFGFGAWALLDLLSRDTPQLPSASTTGAANPLAAHPAHIPARAKHVVFLFMQADRRSGYVLIRSRS